MVSRPTISAQLYARPTAFVDAPFGYDGQCERLAGGLQFFAAWEVIAKEAGKRTGQWLIPVAQMADWCTTLPVDQATRLLAMCTAATSPRPALTLGDQKLSLETPQVMGILNLTPDSFSGGNSNLGDAQSCATQARHMAAQGAALIDLGGESTRPGADIIWEGDELNRVLPVVDALRDSGLILSLDTRKAAVMQAGLAAGVHIINDVSALLYDDRALDVVSASTCPIVLMHFPGSPQDPHSHDHYLDPLTDVYDWLESRIAAVVAAGVDKSRIIADPGIGFGKRHVAHNLQIMNGLALFHGLGVPLLLGASRKRLIGALSNEAPADQRLGGSLALALKAAEQGAQIIRVHDVFETAQALKVWRGGRDTALTLI
jgi:dihydropteroate synthase